MRTLDIKYYALIYAIAESGSAKGAAAMLSLTQSAISHRMREMERRLAITLFERRGHKVYLTAAAQRLLATAIEVIPKMVDAEQDAVALAHSVEPSIRWGMDAHDTLECFLFGAFDLLGSSVDLLRVPDGELAQALLSGTVDLGLFNHPPQQRGINNILLFTDHLVAVVPAASPLARCDSIHAEQAATKTYVTYSARPRSGYEFDLFFNPADVMPKRFKIIDSISLVLQAIAKTQKGMTILSSWQAQTRKDEQGLSIKPLSDVSIEQPWYLSFREDVADTQAVKEIVAGLKEQPLYVSNQ